ncbi:MAG: NupC/NupG family nucleoside CNT transporter [Pyrinomonadaceae bacterium]|nr:NupC/NupG family nucleoside CNT transporter [Pyrinomonadaceae bacterium]
MKIPFKFTRVVPRARWSVLCILIFGVVFAIASILNDVRAEAQQGTTHDTHVTTDDVNTRLQLAAAQDQPNAPPTSPSVISSPAAPSPSPAPSAQTKTLHEIVRETPVPIATRLIGFVGIALMLAVIYLASNDRSRIPWRTVAWGFALQIIFALFILRTRIGFIIFNTIGQGIAKLLAFSDEGAKFVFGRLADPAYIETVSRTMPDSIAFANRFGLIFAFKILPTIIFVASLFAILYYLGIMQRIVYVMALIMQRTMKTSGAESLSNAANVFMGQTEAPLVIAPFIKTMTMSELLTIMIGGMATVSGGVLAAYIGLGIDPVFLLTGSVMAAPASLLIGKMLYPEKETSDTAGTVRLSTEKLDANIIDAASRGAGEGMQLAINVAAMLIAFIALIALVNAILSWFGGIVGLNQYMGRDFDLGLIFGYVFAPLAYVMGVPWADTVKVGDLFGTKLVLNEFVAYLKMSPLGGNVQGQLQPRSILIATYALCGFANFSSIGIQIGGIGGLAPNRRSDLARLGLRALLGGFVATCLTATIAGILS